MNRALSDIERRLANMVRIGTIAELDAANAKVKVTVAGTKTTWLPWTTARAGGDRTWHAPEVGEQVLVLSPSGDMAQGVIIPSIYQAAHGAPADAATVHRTVYADGATVEYDRAAGKMKVEGVKQVEVIASESVLVDAPITTFTGQVIVQGLLTYQAGMAGAAGGGGAAATITGPVNVAGPVAVSGADITTDQDVVAGTISLQTHQHGGVQTGGGNTGVPNP